jgi:glycosyltransferase involved in cell wall biosynthesis
VLIGKGQEEARISAMLEREPVARLKWIPWVPYEELVGWIHRADVCLGIFGDSDKAARVIPNKVFQILSAGAPLITRDSPAIRELLDPDTPGVVLTPCADPQALLAAVREMLADVAGRGTVQHRALAPSIGTAAVGRQLVALLKKTRRGT